MTEHHYIGRFAPSPSGPLHLGSLVCALASYLDAKANFGKWLVRIEDIDPPREQVGADKLIIDSLNAHGLHSDGEILYQSTRAQAYKDALRVLSNQQLCYRCSCTRKRINELNGAYDGHCKTHIPNEEHACAIRMSTSQVNAPLSFKDQIQGLVQDHLESGDFIIHRKDGLFAYQLAVSVDDIEQGITHIVRGSDLLETTAKQILLIEALGGIAPHYAHIPIVVSSPGQKLSKQNHAPAIESKQNMKNLHQAFHALGFNDLPSTAKQSELLSWGIENWSMMRLFNQREINVNTLN